MGKRKSKHKGGDHKIARRRSNREHSIEPQDVEDDIDAFHKRRNIVPLDSDNDPIDSDGSENEEPVFINEDIDKNEDEDEGEDDAKYDHEDSRLAAKIVKQQNYLRAKFGGVEDIGGGEEEEEEDEEKRLGWGGRRARYHGGDNRDFELKSSDDEALKEEEDEILRLQKERAKVLSMEDFGLDNMDEDDADKELTFEEISVKGFNGMKTPYKLSCADGTQSFVEIRKDQTDMSIEEQMDVVYSSAPELVGLLSELKNSVDELERNLNPLLAKVSEQGVKLTGGVHYLKIKQLLLLSYCQSISFYLLLKSEGHSVRDHPIIARLVEIKELVDKIKHLDTNLPTNVEELVRNCVDGATAANSVSECNRETSAEPSEERYDHSDDAEAVGQERMHPLPDGNCLNQEIEDKQKTKHKNVQIGTESAKMLKVRAALEAKLKKSGLLYSKPDKPTKPLGAVKPLDSQFATFADFDDDVLSGKDQLGSRNFMKLSQVLTKQNKQKIISGDDDIPNRDDIGERRKKHELRILASAGVNEREPDLPSGNEVTVKVDEMLDSDGSDDFYSQVKQKRAEKIAAKAEMYKRIPAVPSVPEILEGKRMISHQIEKNRGLTRARKKLIKNPRKKYRTKHDDAQKRRKGQVRDIKKPYGPYGGETSGINAGISRSIRF